MFAGKALHFDCGYRLRAGTEERQVAEVRRHAWEAHGISFSTEEALTVLLRFELEPDEGAPADAALSNTTQADGRDRLAAARNQ
jgi:hypothetical protein